MRIGFNLLFYSHLIFALYKSRSQMWFRLKTDKELVSDMSPIFTCYQIKVSPAEVSLNWLRAAPSVCGCWSDDPSCWLRVCLCYFQSGRIWIFAWMRAATVLVYERGERGEGCPLLSSPALPLPLSPSLSEHSDFELELRLAHLHNLRNTWRTQVILHTFLWPVD